MDTEDLWRERLGTPVPDLAARISWYRRNEPSNPENLAYIEARRLRRIEERRSTHDARMAVRELTIQRQKEAGRQIRIENQRRKQAAANLDFNTKLQLGIRLKLYVKDPEEYKDMQYVLERVSSIPELEKELMIERRLDREWFRGILPQITNDSFHVVAGLLDIRQTVQQCEVSEPQSALVDECENFEIDTVTVPSDGILPAYDEYVYTPTEFTDLQVDSIRPSGNSIYYHSGEGPRLLQSKLPILGLSDIPVESLSTYELLMKADHLTRTWNPDLKLSVPIGRTNAPHINRGVWTSVKREIRKRLPLPSPVLSALQSSGLQRLAAEAVCRAAFSNLRPPCLQRIYRVLISTAT